MYKSNMLDFSSLFLLIFLLAEELAFKINLADQNFNVAFFAWSKILQQIFWIVTNDFKASYTSVEINSFMTRNILSYHTDLTELS